MFRSKPDVRALHATSTSSAVGWNGSPDIMPRATLPAGLPALDSLLSAAVCFGSALLFVGLLYLVDARRVWQAAVVSPSPLCGATPDVEEPATKYCKDDPRVIKRRFVAVGLSSVIVPTVCRVAMGVDVGTFLRLAGLRSEGLLTAAVLPLLLTATIFAGSLALLVADDALFRRCGRRPARLDLAYAFTDPQCLRNYIVGPLSEEWVFRSCMTPVLVSGGFSDAGIVLVAPALFGLAHVHHALTYYHSGGADRRALMQALLRAGIQFGYTTIFGWYAAFLFLRTGHFVAPALAHMFCNVMGFPDSAGVRRHPGLQIVLVAIYILGIVAFAVLLVPLTDPTIYKSVYSQ